MMAPLNGNRTVATVPPANRNDTLAIEIDGLIAPCLVNVMSVNRNTGVANILGNVNVLPNTMATFIYNIGPNNDLDVIPTPAMFVAAPDGSGGVIWTSPGTELHLAYSEQVLTIQDILIIYVSSVLKLQ